MKRNLLAAILAISLPQGDSKHVPGSSETLPSLLFSVDVSCILRSWRIVGVDTCATPHGGVRVCLIVENAYPVGIVESVRQPFATHILEVEPVMKLLGGAPKFGVTSSHTVGAGDGTKLQFSEAHAFEFVPDLLIDTALPLAKPRGEFFALSYLSEIDGFFWRTGLAEMLLHPEEAAKKVALPSCSVLPRPTDCAGTWGSWFPRIGFTTHPSEVMAAHLTSLRAGRVGGAPEGRVVLSRYPFEPRTGHYIQMVRPARRSCVPIGWPLTRLIERNALSLEGIYLFIHFGIFRECRGCYGPVLAGPRVPLG